MVVLGNLKKLIPRCRDTSKNNYYISITITLRLLTAKINAKYSDSYAE